jgi:hypothetical protein
MSELSLANSLARAERRVGQLRRKRRADAGRARLAPAVEEKLMELLGAHERPSMTTVHASLSAFCARRGLHPPSRASLYNAMTRVVPPTYEARDLPVEVRRVLHNIADGQVPGHQVAFAAFNYGSERALSFAAGMPWPCLLQAARLSGFRPKSLALLRAVLAFRGI